MYSPRPLDTVCVGKPNEFTVLVSEIEVVFPKGVFDPVGNFDEGGAVYFGPQCDGGLVGNDGVFREPLDFYLKFARLNRFEGEWIGQGSRME